MEWVYYVLTGIGGGIIGQLGRFLIDLKKAKQEWKNRELEQAFSIYKQILDKHVHDIQILQEEVKQLSKQYHMVVLENERLKARVKELESELILLRKN